MNDPHWREWFAWVDSQNAQFNAHADVQSQEEEEEVEMTTKSSVKYVIFGEPDL